MSTISLPQPPPNHQCQCHYKYVPYDIFDTNWLGDTCRLPLQQSMHNTRHKDEERYQKGTLVWVMLSKGKPKQPKATIANDSNGRGYQALALHKKRRDKKNIRRANNNDAAISNNGDVARGENVANIGQVDKCENNAKQQQTGSEEGKETTTTLNHSLKKFFLRARVVSDDEEVLSTDDCGGEKKQQQQYDKRRILVRYSKGSTYRVRAYNLIPVLEPSDDEEVTVVNEEVRSRVVEEAPVVPPLVIIVPETSIYRRIIKIHTTSQDSFMEVGCDYGITVDKVYQSCIDGHVPKVWPVVNAADADEDKKKSDNDDKKNEDEKEQNDSSRVSCLGVDRSKESIDIANER